MAELRMTAVYFHRKSFALLDSVAGLIPRGVWPSDDHRGELVHFKYRLSYEALVGLARDEPEIISVQPIEDKPSPSEAAPAIALSMEDLELNEAILDALRHERWNLMVSWLLRRNSPLKKNLSVI
jgi:hypothetical protein